MKLRRARTSSSGIVKLSGALLLSAQGLPQKQLTDAAGRLLRPRSHALTPQPWEVHAAPFADLQLLATRQAPFSDYALPPRSAGTNEEASAEAGDGETETEEGQSEAKSSGDGEEALVEAGGEEGHKKVTRAEKAYAFSLIGGVVIVMVLFYLVNWHDEDIRLNTWQTLSMTVSIFASVLIYGSFKVGIQESFGILSEEGITYLNLAIFVTCLIGLQVLLYFLRGLQSETLLPSVGTIFAHLTGFAAMFCGAGFQALDGIKDSGIKLSGFTLGIAAVLGFITLVGAKAREYAISRDPDRVKTESDERWMEEVEEVENDIVSLCLGFAVMQVIRFFISGRLHPYEPYEEPEGVQQWETNALLVSGVGMGLLTCLGSFAATTADAETRLSGSARRLFCAYRNVSSISMAWCLLFWAEWQVYALGYTGIRIGACLAIALLVTVASAVAILALDVIADELARARHNTRALRSMILSLGLAVGFTWERAFDMGLDKFSLHHFSGQGHHFLLRHIPPLVLSLTVLPAWSWYILPHTLQKEKS